MNLQPKIFVPRTHSRAPILVGTLFAIGLLLIAGCTDSKKLQKLPMVVPFDTQSAGFKIDTTVQVTDHNAYEFGFKLGFREGDEADRKRVLKLAGDPRRDKAGKLIGPGVSIPVRLRISSVNPSDLEHTFEKEFVEVQQTAVSDTDVYAEITTVRLKRGTYRVTVENLKVIPELKGTPIRLYVAADAKSSSIPE